MLQECWDNLRTVHPLIHNITNYVTVNDVANVLLACGASPIMADEMAEVEEITALCSGLNINIGTLNDNTIPSMFIAGKEARKLGHVVLLDPVGAGASSLRTDTARKLMKTIDFTAVKGNMSEIKTLALGSGATKGVDVDVADLVTADSLDSAVAFVKDFAKAAETVVAVTGPIDLVSDGKSCYVIFNGHPLMQQVTGTGCMIAGMMTAALAANPGHSLEAAAASVIAMGLAGEMAYENLQPRDGNCTYRSRIIDALCHIDGKTLKGGAKYEIR